MTLSDEQVKKVKEDLTKQVDEAGSLSDDKKKELKEKIQSMTAEQVEETLKQQQGQQGQGQQASQQGSQQQCVFCSIVFGDIPSYQVGETDNSIAVLDIRPISEGHSVVVPREHIESYDNLPKDAFDLASAIGGKIKQSLQPKNIKIYSTNLFGHQIINVLPVYSNEDENSERQEANQEKLQELYGKLSIGKVGVSEGSSGSGQGRSQEQNQQQGENSSGQQSSSGERGQQGSSQQGKQQEKKEEINEDNTWLPRRVP